MTDIVHFLLALSAVSSVWVVARHAYRELAREDEWDLVLDPQWSSLRACAPDNDNGPAPHDAPTEPGTQVPAYEPTRQARGRRRAA